MVAQTIQEPIIIPIASRISNVGIALAILPWILLNIESQVIESIKSCTTDIKVPRINISSTGISSCPKTFGLRINPYNSNKTKVSTGNKSCQKLTLYVELSPNRLQGN